MAWRMCKLCAPSNGQGGLVVGLDVVHVDLKVREEHQGSAAVLAVINVVVHASEGVTYNSMKTVLSVSYDVYNVNKVTSYRRQCGQSKCTLQLGTLRAVHDSHKGADIGVLDKISAKAGGLLVGLADGVDLGLVAVVGGGKSQGRG